MKVIYQKVSLALAGLLMFFVIGAAAQDENAVESSSQRGANDALVDFNGDGKSDWAVIRGVAPPPGVTPLTWYIRHNGEDNVAAMRFGFAINDIPVPVDYDGDGKDDIAVWRNTPLAGQPNAYYIWQSATNSLRVVAIGSTGDTPVPADYDADGKDDPAVYSTPSAQQGAGPGNWCYVGSRNNPQQTITCIPFGGRYGTQTDQVDDPYPGDFDGDGRADIRVQRRSDITNPLNNQPAIFITQLGATSAVTYDYFGLSNDRIIPGDYDGDGKTDICVSRDFNGSFNPPRPIKFYIRYSSGLPDETIHFGVGINFNFAQGDYDGDGKDDIALLVRPDQTNPQIYFAYRPSSNPSEGFRSYPWGTQGDRPAVGYNNR